MDKDELAEVFNSVQYALDCIDTAKANKWITRPSFFDTAVGELNSAKIRIALAQKRNK